jgi:hypothetical protein
MHEVSDEEVKHVIAAFKRIPDARTRYFLSLLLDSMADSATPPHTATILPAAPAAKKSKTRNTSLREVRQLHQ